MRGVRWLVLVALGSLGCPYLSDGELDARLDLDGDGVPRPEDCDDGDAAVGGPGTWHVDTDGDGFGGPTPSESCTWSEGLVTDASDCDDTDPAIFPGADEACNELDDDCDGAVDEGLVLPTWYRDADQDGHGEPTVSQQACFAPSGYVALGDDCDDLEAGVHPLAQEVCDPDDVDEDCDELADDDDLDVQGQVTVYQDGDGDGFGVEEVTSAACDDGDGWALEAGDCDDGDAERHPDTWWYRDADEDGYGDSAYGVRACADVVGYVRDDQDCDDAEPAYSPEGQEVCDPLDVDEDCDGLVDDWDDTVEGQLTIYADGDGDGYGDDSTETLACDQWSGWVLEAGDCELGDPSVSPGEEELCADGQDQDCDGDIDCDDVNCARAEDCGYFDLGLADARWVGHYSQEAATASALAWAGDADGDGLDDILVGAGGWSGMPHGAYLVTGASAVSGDLMSAAVAFLTEEHTNDGAGSAVAGLGDTDGDSFGEFVVGANEYDEFEYGAGAVYLFRGPVTRSASLGTADAILLGEGNQDRWASVLDGGRDLTGNGVPDVLIGGQQSNGAYIVDPSFLTGTQLLSDSGVKVSGSSTLGYELDLCMDSSGDGVAEVLLAQPSNYGMAYLVDGPIIVGGSVSTLAVATFLYTAESDGFADTVACGGDTDADGFGEIAINASNDSRAGAVAGAVYLFSGPFAGSTSASSAVAVLLGESAGDYAGSSITLDADLDLDGYADVIVGSAQGNSNGADSGTAYVLFGPVSGTISLADADARIGAEFAGDYLGDTLAAGGDFDGDGYVDLLLGAPGYDSGSTGSTHGAAYLILGSRF